MSNINKMEAVVKELAVVNAAANVDLNTVPQKNRGGIAIAKVNATERLVGIRDEYKKMLAERAFSLFVVGAPEDQKTFARIAEAEGETVTVSAMHLYRRLAFDASPAIGDARQFGSTALGLLVRSIEDVARETGTQRLLQTPLLKDVAIVKTFDDTVNTVRELVLQSMGYEFNKEWIENEAFKSAFAQGRSEKVIPIVLTDSQDGDLELQSKIFNGKGLLVRVPSTVNRDFVLAQFERIRETLFGPKKVSTTTFTDGPIPKLAVGTRIEEKRPLSPEVLADTLQDPIHATSGKLQAAKSVKVKAPKQNHAKQTTTEPVVIPTTDTNTEES